MRRLGYIAGAILIVVGGLEAFSALLEIASRRGTLRDPIEGQPLVESYLTGWFMIFAGLLLWLFVWLLGTVRGSQSGPTVRYEFRGPVNMVGWEVDARGMHVKQEQKQTIELGALANELERLRKAMTKAAKTVDQQNAIGRVAMAEQAARDGDGPQTEQHLWNAGRWALKVATEIGVPLATAALISLLTSYPTYHAA